MAGIDKTYVSDWKDWKEITEWMKSFERKLPNGIIIKGRNYLYYPDYTKEEVEKWIKEVNDEIPIMNTSETMDYFLIKECPLEIIQDRMKSVYSSDYYEDVKAGMSEYDLFVRPRRVKHLRVIKKPKYYKTSKWFNNYYGKWMKDRYTVHIKLPYDGHTWYNDCIEQWILPGELGSISSSSADVYCSSFKSLIRKIKTWHLPPLTIIKASHFKWSGGECEFIVKD